MHKQIFIFICVATFIEYYSVSGQFIEIPILHNNLKYI